MLVINDDDNNYDWTITCRTRQKSHLFHRSRKSRPRVLPNMRQGS